MNFSDQTSPVILTIKGSPVHNTLPAEKYTQEAYSPLDLVLHVMLSAQSLLCSMLAVMLHSLCTACALLAIV